MSVQGIPFRQKHLVGDRIPRHRHLEGYAALVLSGGYVEAGDRGRAQATPGDILFHERFEAHRDLFCAQGAEILNLPLAGPVPFIIGRCPDPDAIVRLSERDPRAAADLLAANATSAEAAFCDWPDLLAAKLRTEDVFLAEWAARHGLTPAMLSRGFRQAYGVSPKRYRLEIKAAAAARLLAAGSQPADASNEAGFADQPHLGRTIRQLYGTTPARMRIVQVRSRPE